LTSNYGDSRNKKTVASGGQGVAQAIAPPNEAGNSNAGAGSQSLANNAVVIAAVFVAGWRQYYCRVDDCSSGGIQTVQEQRRVAWLWLAIHTV